MFCSHVSSKHRKSDCVFPFYFALLILALRSLLSAVLLLKSRHEAHWDGRPETKLDDPLEFSSSRVLSSVSSTLSYVHALHAAKPCRRQGGEWFVSSPKSHFNSSCLQWHDAALEFFKTPCQSTGLSLRAPWDVLSAVQRLCLSHSSKPVAIWIPWSSQNCRNAEICSSSATEDVVFSPPCFAVWLCRSQWQSKVCRGPNQKVAKRSVLLKSELHGVWKKDTTPANHKGWLSSVLKKLRTRLPVSFSFVFWILEAVHVYTSFWYLRKFETWQNQHYRNVDSSTSELSPNAEFLAFFSFACVSCLQPIEPRCPAVTVHLSHIATAEAEGSPQLVPVLVMCGSIRKHVQLFVFRPKSSLRMQRFPKNIFLTRLWGRGFCNDVYPSFLQVWAEGWPCLRFGSFLRKVAITHLRQAKHRSWYDQQNNSRHLLSDFYAQPANINSLSWNNW